MTREFTDTPAKRDRVPLLIGLISPSGAGKTYSALRLATGIVSVSGGEVFGVDTEANRMKHYAWDPERKTGFHFRHVPMVAPFNPLSYLDAIMYCVKRGAGCVIVDSFSHEHEGVGGVLDMHEREVDRMSNNSDNYKERQKHAARGWIKPKRERVTMINGIVQTMCNFIFCFRASQKLDWKHKQASGEPTDQGWQPIGAMPLVYEMTARALFYPGAEGVPDWNPQIAAERELIKRPEQFRDLFERHKGKPVSEDMGAEMARWACGVDAPSSSEFSETVAAIAMAADMASLEALIPRLDDAKKRVTSQQLRQLRDAYAQQKSKLQNG